MIIICINMFMPGAQCKQIKLQHTLKNISQYLIYFSELISDDPIAGEEKWVEPDWQYNYNTATCKWKSWKKQQMPLTTKVIPDRNEMQNFVYVHLHSTKQINTSRIETGIYKQISLYLIMSQQHVINHWEVNCSPLCKKKSSFDLGDKFCW